MKDAQQKVKDAQKESQSQEQGTKGPKLSKEVQEACDKAKLDLIAGTAKGELDRDQRSALEGVIRRQCE